MTDRYLFSAGDLLTQIQNWAEQLQKEVSAYSADALLNASVESLVEHFVNGFTVRPIGLDVEGVSVDQGEVDIDISNNINYAVFDRSRPVMKRGTRLRFHVPFSGDANLFGLRPSTFTLSGIPAVVVGPELVFEVRQLEPDPAAARAEFERQLASVQQMLGSQRDQLRSYHDQLPGTARQLVERRRQKLLADRQAVASLGYPLRSREGQETYASQSLSPRQRLGSASQKPGPGGSKPFLPEPVLSTDDFARVVQVVGSITKVMERSPSAFVRATEETLRDHILVQLNGHFEGKAVGEAFNASGKTDILVRDGDRNLLVCECKFWKGAKSLDEAVDQLMSYLTWRDAKALLVMFNRNTQMTTVLSAVEATLPKYPSYRRGLTRPSETVFECVLARKDDNDREVQLSVMVMDVPSQNPPKRSKESAPPSENTA